MCAATNRVVLFILLCLAAAAQNSENLVGSVKTTHGGAIVRRGSETIQAREGLHLVLNDILQTSADGQMGAILQDGTRLALGPNSELRIDRFVYEPADGKFALFLRLARGVFTYVSGKIARFAPESVSVETPVGVVGLRGTHFAVSIDGP